MLEPRPQRRYLDIGRVAERVCEESGADVGATIEALCWPALQHGTSPNSNDTLEEEHPGTSDLDFLCAAAYLNLISVAERLLQEGYSPHSNSYLFSSPMKLAAWAGNAQMLEIFQEHVPEMENFHNAVLFAPNWRGKVGPDSILGAAIRGDVAMVRLAVYPPSRAAAHSTEFAGDAFGSVNRRSSTGIVLTHAQRATRDVEVYTYLDAFFSTPDDLSYALSQQARWGNLAMVRHLLDAGADTRGVSGRTGNPLAAACARGHEDVVDLLLERGADPNFSGDMTRTTFVRIPIVEAAACGSMAIVRKLLAHGADLTLTDMDIPVGVLTLFRALTVEHTEMVRFLLAAGVDLNVVGKDMMDSIVSRGLDSMAKLLREEGVTLDQKESAGESFLVWENFSAMSG